MSQPYVGQIFLFGFNFVPQGFARCDGSLLPISQYQTLFQLIGTTYGGDGQNTFAVPDLTGRVPIHQGLGSFGSTYTLGQMAGSETITLVTAQIPGHIHDVNASQVTGALLCKKGLGNTRSPVGHVPAIEMTGVTLPYSTQPPDVTMGGSVTAHSGMSELTGGSVPHGNMQPYLVLNYCISLFGIFPSQT